MPNLPSVAGELGLIVKGRTTRTLQLRVPSSSHQPTNQEKTWWRQQRHGERERDGDRDDDFANAAFGIALSSIFWDWFYNYLILSWPQHWAQDAFKLPHCVLCVLCSAFFFMLLKIWALLILYIYTL